MLVENSSQAIHRPAARHVKRLFHRPSLIDVHVPPLDVDDLTGQGAVETDQVSDDGGDVVRVIRIESIRL